MERNIYKIGKELFITDNEEIKEGDYVYHTQMFNYIGFTGIAKVGKQRVNQEFEITSLDGQHTYYSCKEPKVVLTTDQDLINDGVQAIDDDFLEWFVKNPSCEWVEISLEETQYGSGIYEYVIYKREIPKEEPKQETLEKYSERFNNKENEVVDGIFNPENWGRRVVKQETLEEAAKDFIENTMKFSFTSCATKTQANRMLKCVEFGAKWQAERMYSEEEVIELLIKFNQEIQEVEDVRIWFEKFKKK